MGLGQRRHVNDYQLAVFFRQFSSMFGAGIPIHQCLEFYSESDPTEMGQAVSDCAEAIGNGHSLSQAFKQQPDIFPGYAAGLVKVGEETGTLSTTLNRLSDLLERNTNLQSRLKAAITYPCFLIGIFALVFVCFCYGILPHMVPLLEATHTEPPWPTKALISLGALVASKSFLVAMVASAVAIYFQTPIVMAQIYADPKRAQFVDRLPFLIPVAGNTYRQILIARLLFTLSTCIEMGLSITRALALTQGLVSNHHVRKSLQQVSEGVKEGEGLGEILTEIDFFPKTLGQFVSCIEETGTLSDGLAYVAAFNEESAGQAIDTCSSFIEPLIMVVLGCLGGFLVLAVMGPVLSMLQSIA